MPSRDSLLVQFGVFAVVGAVSTACHFATLWTLHQPLGVNLIVATTMGYLVGAVINYLLNRNITFSTARTAHEAAVPRFATVVLAGMALNAGIMAVLERTAPGVNFLLRQCVATGIVLVFNFVLNRLWTFRPADASGAEGDFR
jgi:putative flippase GtrA